MDVLADGSPCDDAMFVHFNVFLYTDAPPQYHIAVGTVISLRLVRW